MQIIPRIVDFTEAVVHGSTHLFSLLEQTLKEGALRSAVVASNVTAGKVVVATQLCCSACHTWHLHKSIQKGDRMKQVVDLTGILFGGLLVTSLLAPSRRVSQLWQIGYVAHHGSLALYHGHKRETLVDKHQTGSDKHHTGSQRHNYLMWGCLLDCIGHSLEFWVVGELAITDCIGLAGHCLLIRAFFLEGHDPDSCGCCG